MSPSWLLHTWHRWQLLGNIRAQCCVLQLLQIANTKYQLPGSNNTYVDLVDDEDVKLMFDEWADWLQDEGKGSRNAKLHVYIDWQSSSSAKRSSGGGGAAAGLDIISETASADTPVARAPPPPTAEGPTSADESPMGQSSEKLHLPGHCCCLLLCGSNCLQSHAGHASFAMPQSLRTA